MTGKYASKHSAFLAKPLAIPLVLLYNYSMTDVSAAQFLDILKDPNMPLEKRRLLEIIRNPKTQVVEITVSDYGFGTDAVATNIRIITYD